MDQSPAPWTQVAPVVAAIVEGPVGDPVDLGGSTRSHVWRVRSGDASYVVKAVQATAEGDPFAREAASLGALGGSGVAPGLVGMSMDPALVVMEDLGVGHHLADALLSDDRGLAAGTLRAWASSVGRLHRAGTPAVLDDFTRRLGAIAPDAPAHGTGRLTERAAGLWRGQAEDARRRRGAGARGARPAGRAALRRSAGADPR